jgi:hypothetical protein
MLAAGEEKESKATVNARGCAAADLRIFKGRVPAFGLRLRRSRDPLLAGGYQLAPNPYPPAALAL